MKIGIKGPIISSNDQWIYDWFGMEATSPKKVADALLQAEPNEKIEVEVNSGGGSVFAGSEIYTTIKSYNGNTISKIVGLAGSAASVAAMGSKRVVISPTGQIMIHNASGSFSGDYNEMNKGSEILQNINATIANAYMLKTGMSQEKLLEMMNKESWLTPQQALELGFVDEIMFTDGMQLTNNINSFMLPPEVINKVRNEIKRGLLSQEPQNSKELELLKAKLALKCKL